ncbi:DUF4261 domain-containing protein [Allorhizobium sp. BGMRC 0089]|uniref:DUF4261 domain-containing protein n=1 Tax=Allorhizobium sonneratiae TaxID=2934936 RepID=UPI002033A604|nr:DUF4261 domain-containing protein [Allorhizobium sonneratiae]MCM2294512.1 DUF4261 domain-containing protein [Allorhizobium sonneratiae]
MCIDAQAPLAETDPEFRNAAWLWPKAWDELRQHRAHMVVSVAGGRGVKHRALILQRLLHAIFSVSPSALGIHYASGTLLPKKMVVPLLQQGGQLALMLFVSCYFAREADGRFPRPGILASTKGLTDFGSMEIEVRGFSGSVQDLYAWILSLASGLLDQQFQIKDGDTFSVGEGEPVKITIEKSMFYDAKVYCLHFQ